MGRVWFVVLVTMCCVATVVLIWHWSGMRDIKMYQHAEDAKIEANIARLAAYRDVLSKKGKAEAVVFLQQSQKSSYGI